MDNGNFGKKNQGQERSNGKSSRESKKNSRSNKSKTIQRGLGIAALEKIMLEMESKNINSAPSPQPPAYPTISQLQEQMRIQEAYSSPSTSSLSTNRFPGYFQRLLMEVSGGLQSESTSHGGIQFSTMPSLIPGNGTMLESQRFTEPNILWNFMGLPVESAQKNNKEQNNSVGSSINQNYGIRDDQELDLELKLSY